MDNRLRSENVKLLADANARERLKNQEYSKDVHIAFDLLQKFRSKTEKLPIELVLMDIAWQLSGNIPTEYELARVYNPIDCFFLGTVYHDDLLDSINKEIPKALVGKLGMSTCLIMGNILYCEALLSLFEINRIRNNINILKLLNSLKKMVRDVAETEIYRRNHIGKILPLKEFFRIWRILTPNTTCIEIGGILGDSDRKKIQILTNIGSNLSLVYRIHKEVGEIYGLRGSLQEILRHKPPPLPVSLSYDSASPLEKKKLEKTIRHLSSIDKGNEKTRKDIEFIIDVVAKYDAISNALSIHNEIYKEIRELITRLSSSKHENVLNSLLGSEFHSQDSSNKI